MPTPKEYQALLEGGCPWCGESLSIRHGKFGEFIACSEWCGFTKSVPGRSFYPSGKTPPKCAICNGTGLVPSKVLGKFSGKPIPNCFSNCACREDEQEHYQQASPEDFDFPMSDTFRGFSYEYCGLPDPGYTPKEEPVEPQSKQEQWTQDQWESVQQIRAHNLFLQKKVNELLEKKRVDKQGRYSNYI